MKNILSFKLFESNNQNKYCIEWELDDKSGNCSPSGSTRIDKGTVYFNDISEKDESIEKVIDESQVRYIRRCELYAHINILKNNVWEFLEDVNFSEYSIY